jgi:hypothetical protein
MPNVQVVAFAVFDLGSVAELIAMLICLFGSSKQRSMVSRPMACTLNNFNDLRDGCD